MDLRQLPALNAIRAFEAAARHENFSRAADELYVTHGAVSHQVRALEEELGVQLFTRNGKRLCLTDAGMRYAQQVRTALMVIADATREVRASDRGRRLVVSMLSSFAARFITPRIGTFIERHPEIDVELQSTNSLTDFARDDVDLAIRFGSGTYPGLHVEPLFEEVFFPACSPTLNGGKLPRTPADLVHYNLLRSDDELWRPWFDAAGLDTLTEPKRGILYQDSSNLLLAAIDGQGIALVRRSLAVHDLLDGRLVRLFDIDGQSPWHYFFVCPPPLLNTPRVQAFRTWLLQEVAEYKLLCDELDARRAAGKTPAECAQEGGWKAALRARP
ncbi:XRE family transcriptional regulator [Burkholderia sp. MSMB0856]|uniref:transcriptional regulator GcvA n=1 Tax=Burkholderia sp. MSMB0856 TaxID=1637869 RepID=UPI000754DFE1|nr:transcriptional regulator GcvA [Burkholderia sp. MSMB0856]AOJ87958.1 XRE family transcriptional regulator [Burkholderia sp. MSMB0856]KVH31740.1 XRE family transcriptional regulator [Burkholderia sp. MSMB0856]